MPKLSEIKYLLTENQSNVDILCLCETFLSESIQTRELNVNGFDVMRRDRGNKPGGGILIYTSNQIKTIRREDLEYPSIESVLFEVIYKFQKPVVFGYVYRPPNSSIEWLSAFESMIVKAEMEDKELVLLGISM